MKKNYLYLLLFGLTMVSFYSKATIVTATTSGNWDSAFTWDIGVPKCGDTVIIPAGVIVTVTVNVDLDTGDPLCPLFQMTISGDLRFAHGKKMHLALGSCVGVESGGRVGASSKGGGASESIYIGPDRVWQASGGALNGVATLGCAIMLPVELIDFSILIKNQGVELNFTSASERDLDYYVIESSRDGSFWQEVQTLKAAENSIELRNYSYTDKNPFNGLSYYRLKSVNMDGSQNNLEIISCEYYSSKFLMYPIPVNKLMFLEGDNLEQSSVSIFNSLGELIEVELSLVGDKYSFNFEQIKNGVYFLTIQNVNIKRTERIIVAHK